MKFKSTQFYNVRKDEFIWMDGKKIPSRVNLEQLWIFYQLLSRIFKSIWMKSPVQFIFNFLKMNLKTSRLEKYFQELFFCSYLNYPNNKKNWKRKKPCGKYFPGHKRIFSYFFLSFTINYFNKKRKNKKWYF